MLSRTTQALSLQDKVKMMVGTSFPVLLSGKYNKKRESPLYDLHLPCCDYNILIFNKNARVFYFFSQHLRVPLPPRWDSAYYLTFFSSLRGLCTPKCTKKLHRKKSHTKVWDFREKVTRTYKYIWALTYYYKYIHHYQYLLHS